MERGKSGSGRGGKSKTPQFPADLFALGSKTSNEGKPRPTSSHSSSKLGSSSSGDRDRKRDASSAPSSSGPVPTKKSKILSGSGSQPTKGSSSSSSSGSSVPSQDAWETVALEVDVPQLTCHVIEASDADDTDKVVGLLCGAIKLLRQQRSKIDSVLFMSLAYLSKIKKSVYTHETVVSALCSLLRRQDSLSSNAAPGTFKPITPRVNLQSSLLSVLILMRTFQDVKRWPDTLLRIYLMTLVASGTGWTTSWLRISFRTSSTRSELNLRLLSSLSPHLARINQMMSLSKI
uniref:Uncharacterized protein n=1 Tax=Lygus hesperus TaxID=30085 RepID=A0A0K8TA78_LYGHE